MTPVADARAGGRAPECRRRLPCPIWGTTRRLVSSSSGRRARLGHDAGGAAHGGRCLVAMAPGGGGHAGCSSAGAGRGDRPPAPPSASPSGPDLSDADAVAVLRGRERRLSTAPTVYPDALGGPFDGRVVTADGGGVERTPGPAGRGRAVAFPARCDGPSGCPRAIVEVAPDPALDPGESDFEFGATCGWRPTRRRRGSNIVQKGRFAADDGLWKLQVDSDEGEPSCVVAVRVPTCSRSGPSVSIADCSWHRVVCRAGPRRVSPSRSTAPRTGRRGAPDR